MEQELYLQISNGLGNLKKRIYYFTEIFRGKGENISI